MLSTSGILGYGFAEESLKIGMSWEPHVIGCDGGSTDPGPHYLGSGKSFTSRLSVKRDLRQGAVHHRHVRGRRRRAAFAGHRGSCPGDRA
jgi:hypothetical protein